jgi:HSP20 family protein
MTGFFDDLWTRDLGDWGLQNYSGPSSTLPAVNIADTHDNFQVEMAAPGMTKDDFKIELDNETLTISAEKKTEHEEKNGDRYNRREFSYQSFQRSFHLPKSVVDEGKIEAKYDNGILRIVIPKKEEARKQTPRMIDIK